MQLKTATIRSPEDFTAGIQIDKKNLSARVIRAITSFLSGRKVKSKPLEFPAGFFLNAGLAITDLLRADQRGSSSTTIEIYLNLATLTTLYLGAITLEGEIENEDPQMVLLAIQEDIEAFSYNRKVPHFIRKWIYSQRRKIRIEYEVQVRKKTSFYADLITLSHKTFTKYTEGTSENGWQEELKNVSIFDDYVMNIDGSNKKEELSAMEDTSSYLYSVESANVDPVLECWIDGFRDETLTGNSKSSCKSCLKELPFELESENCVLEEGLPPKSYKGQYCREGNAFTTSENRKSGLGYEEPEGVEQTSGEDERSFQKLS